MSKDLQERIRIAVVSYPGLEHREFRQSHLDGIALALENMEENIFEALYKETLPTEHAVSSILAELDKEKVLAILGPFDSETADLVIPRAAHLGLPVLSTGASSPLLNNGNLAGTTFFRLGGSDLGSLQQLVEWLVTEHPAETVLTIAESKAASARFGDDQFIIFGKLAFGNSLGILPLRFERGCPHDISDHCEHIIHRKTPQIRAAVLLGYSDDTLAIAKILQSLQPHLAIYTVNPKRDLFERSGLDGIRAVASEFEYSSLHRIETFRRQYASRFSHSRPHTFHASALCAYDLVQILHARVRESNLAAITDLHERRSLLLKMLCESHRRVEAALVSDGIFTSNQELSFHSRNIVLHNCHFVEYSPPTHSAASSSRLKERLRQIWEKYRRLVEGFGFLKHNLDFWAFVLLLVIIGGTVLLWLKPGILHVLRDWRERLEAL